MRRLRATVAGRAAGIQGFPVASLRETVRVATLVVLPILAQGVIARRRRMVALAGRLGTDDRGVRVLQRLRARYGAGPLHLPVPGRSVLLVLSPDDVRQVLTQSPEPFATANREKRAALAHFQPHGVLISRGRARAERRRFTEAVLDTGRPLHRQAEAITRVVHEEARQVRDAAGRQGELTWHEFITGWWRAVRRVVLGEAARDDHALTDDLTALRRAANWAGLHPRQHSLQARLQRRLSSYLGRAEPASLAAVVATTANGPDLEPADQVAHWLFAFDAAGAVSIRALALLARHPEQARQARLELGDRDLTRPQDLAFLQATVLESVRLWPTTPQLLRETTAHTGLGGGWLPADTAVLIPSWYFHRDEHTLSEANRFEPGRWLDERAHDNWALMPFSGGPGRCPGRELVLFTTGSFLATLLQHCDYTLTAPPALRSDRPLPRALNQFALRFRLS